MKKHNVCVLFGGTSDESSVSLESAKYIYSNLDENEFNIVSVFLDRDLQFYFVDTDLNTINAISEIEKDKPVGFINKELLLLNDKTNLSKVDVVFSVIHGESGEDGVLQGFFAIQKIPYCGSNLASSSLAINKYLTKIFLEKEDIPLCKSMWLKKGLQNSILSKVEKSIGFPLIIKPTSLGSSIGVFKVNHPDEFLGKLDEGFAVADEVMVEEYVENRELECAIIEIDGEIKVSEIGEIGKSFGVYSFDEKYLEDNAELIIPALVDVEVKEKIQELSKKIFRLLGCSGFARIDFFLDENNQLFFNEINTIPGFTEISMFPKLIEALGYLPSELIGHIIKSSKN